MPETDDTVLLGRLTREQWNQLKEERDYDGIFNALAPDWSVQIERLRPTWCDGWCETVSHDPEEPIDLDYIRDQWGGQRFKLRIKDEVGRYVTAIYVKIDGDPKRWGKRVPHPEEVEHDRKRETRELDLAAMRNQPQQTTPAPPAIDPTIGQLLADSIKSAASSKDAQVEYLADLVKQSMKDAGKNRELDDVLKTATTMKQFMEDFGIGGGSQSDDFIGSNLGKFIDLLDKKDELDKRKQRPPQQQQQPGQRQIRVVNLGPTGSVPPSQTVGAQQAPAAAPPGGGAPPPGAPAELNRSELACTLAGMDPTDATAVLLSALAKMEPEKRHELENMLMGQYVPEGEYEEDDDDEGDDEAIDDSEIAPEEPGTEQTA